jgi:hypothetical protein
VEFFLNVDSYSDTSALKLYHFDLPEGSQLTGDKAYNDYLVEDTLQAANLRLTPLRKKSSKRSSPPWATYLMSSYRKLIETTGSMIERLLQLGLISNSLLLLFTSKWTLHRRSSLMSKEE